MSTIPQKEILRGELAKDRKHAEAGDPKEINTATPAPAETRGRAETGDVEGDDSLEAGD